MNFLIDNLILIGVALVSGGLLLWPLLKRGGGATALTPLLATQLINHRNAVVVDVRDEKDFAIGSLAGARNIPFAKLGDRAGELVRFKARPVLIVCDAGQQAAQATATFKAQGFEEAYSLAGGISAWNQAGLPLVQTGRDAIRAVPKDAGRKSKGERSNERGRTGKDVRPGLVTAAPFESPIINLPGDASPAVSEVPATPDVAASPNRVKELS